MHDLVIKTTVKQSLVQNALFAGSAIAALGILLLLITGIQLPLEVLDKYGLFIYISSFFIISIGLIPYQRIKKLSINPERLQSTPYGLEIFSKNKKILSIPHRAIDALHYAQSGKKYGLAIFLKEQPEQKIKVFHHTFDIQKFQKQSYNEWGSSLFFPYYSEKSCLKLLDNLKSKQ